MKALLTRSTSALRFDLAGKIGKALALALIAAWGVATFNATAAATAASDAVVLHWNAVAVQAVGAAPPFPATRAMATVQVAVFEAVNAISRRYQPYLGSLGAAPGASAEAAAVVAAHDTLASLFPSQSTLALLDAEQSASLAAVADGPAKEAGIAVGRAAALLMIAARTNDGSQTPAFYAPAGSAPYQWQPTPSCASPPANGRGVFLHWQFVKPFGIESASQFRAKAPPALVDGSYANDLNEVAAVGDAQSTLRPPDRADVARLYAGQPPHRGWNSIARQLAAERGADEITRTARTLAVLNMAMSDAHVTVFESKYYYATWRPETAIARADEDNNHLTAPNSGFRPYVVTPCFPSYPSAHGAGGGAARAVLERAYGRKHHDLVNSDSTVPDVVLHYTDLRTITDDVSDARVYGGIHFRYDQEAGERMGVDIGRYIDGHRLPPRAPSDGT
jgi:hypothetical protein